MHHVEKDILNRTTAELMDIKYTVLPSLSTFLYALNVTYVFGLPMNVNEKELAMDIDRSVSIVKARDGDRDKEYQFVLNSGMTASALEHTVPEQIFSTSEEAVEGISAVKALAIANDAGIPIYSINKTNIDTILPQLQLDEEVISEIQNGVNAGKEVTVSKTNISFNGWTGCGFIIIDPETGAGAYMISGGYSGGVVLTAIGAMMIVLGLYAMTNPLLGPALGAYLIGKGVLLMTIGVQWLTDKFTNKLYDCITLFSLSYFGIVGGILGLLSPTPISIIFTMVGLASATYAFIDNLEKKCSP